MKKLRLNVKQIALDYRSGMSIREVARKHSSNYESIRRRLLEFGEPLRPQSYRKHKFNWSQAISDFESGLSMMQVADKHGVSYAAVRNCLIRSGIPLRPPGRYGPLLACNETFFDDLSQEAPAYWLGFIMADGYVRKRKPSYSGELSIKLAPRDRVHLEKFAKVIEFQGNVLPTTAGQYYIRISNEHIYQRLLSLGVDPGTKSYTLKFPNYIPDESMRHFLRGYLDGDGGLYITPDKKRPSPAFTITIIGTEHFLNGFQRELASRLPITKGYLALKGQDGAAWRLTWGGRVACAHIARFLYAVCTIALDRKLVKAQQIMAWPMSYLLWTQAGPATSRATCSVDKLAG